MKKKDKKQLCTRVPVSSTVNENRREFLRTRRIDRRVSNGEAKRESAREPVLLRECRDNT